MDSGVVGGAVVDTVVGFVVNVGSVVVGTGSVVVGTGSVVVGHGSAIAGTLPPITAGQATAIPITTTAVPAHLRARGLPCSDVAISATPILQRLAEVSTGD
ncbi:hypothetical protein [Mycolicibacterium houstonense]|uniref:hypothetical protein n=1 Tax=Mycolicibacterium houstonense TaxID=146021 RepID=UPI000B29F2B9|nr:hypothetical protein [Mycolicibacterium houstonense]